MGKGSGECRRLDLRSLVTTKECASTGRVRWMDRHQEKPPALARDNRNVNQK